MSMEYVVVWSSLCG